MKLFLQNKCTKRIKKVFLRDMNTLNGVMKFYNEKTWTRRRIFIQSSMHDFSIISVFPFSKYFKIFKKNSKWDFQTEPSGAGARRVVRNVWVPSPQELEDFQTEPSAAGARRVVTSVRVPTIHLGPAGRRPARA